MKHKWVITPRQLIGAQDDWRIMRPVAGRLTKYYTCSKCGYQSVATSRKEADKYSLLPCKKPHEG